MTHRIWPVLAGFLLSVTALVSYPLLFVRWPLTRDLPWVNLLLFGFAGWLVVAGVRAAFGGRSWRRARIAISLGLAAASVAVFAGFIAGVLILPRRLPASAGAPEVGQRAPEFTLVDVNDTPVSLAGLLSSDPAGARASKGVLLIFYRGYW